MNAFLALGDEPAWRRKLRDALNRVRRPRGGPDFGASQGSDRRRPVVVVLDAASAGLSLSELVHQLAGSCEVVPIGDASNSAHAPQRPLRWITALQGREVRLIRVEDVCYCRSDSKYTAVVTADGSWLIRMPLRALAERLDTTVFWQIHRGTLVNANAIRSVRRDDGGQLELRLKARDEVLKVSDGYAHRFRHL